MNVCLAVLAVFLVFFLSSSSPKAQPPILVVGQDVSSIEGFVKGLSRLPSPMRDQFPQGIMAYTAINDLAGLNQPSDYGAGVNHVDFLLRKYPQIRVVQLGLFIKYMLQEISEGGLDSQIDGLGAWIKGCGREVYLRIGYEFDNPENEYEPSAYVRAYKHIVDRLRAQGVSNVYFVWHSIAWKAAEWPPRDPRQWYPGDEYVDWIGISYFDPYQDDPRNSLADFALARQKPLMIAEAAPILQLSIEEKRAWMVRLFGFMENKNVRFLSYINVDWDRLPMFADKQWGDSRLDPDPQLFQSFLHRLQ